MLDAIIAEPRFISTKEIASLTGRKHKQIKKHIKKWRKIPSLATPFGPIAKGKGGYYITATLAADLVLAEMLHNPKVAHQFIESGCYNPGYTATTLRAYLQIFRHVLVKKNGKVKGDPWAGCTDREEWENQE